MVENAVLSRFHVSHIAEGNLLLVGMGLFVLTYPRYRRNPTVVFLQCQWHKALRQKSSICRSFCTDVTNLQISC